MEIFFHIVFFHISINNHRKRIPEMLSPEEIEEEIQKILGRKWRKMAESYLNHLKNPRPREDETTGTFDRQDPYVQKKIRRFYLRLSGEERAGLANLSLETLLKKIGLQPAGFLSKEDLLLCIQDLQVKEEEQLENEFSNLLLHLAWPEIFPPFREGVRSLEEVAAEQELQLVNVGDRRVYIGRVVGLDSHRLLVKYANSKAFVINFWDLPPSSSLPAAHAQVEIKFIEGQIVDFKFNNI